MSHRGRIPGALWGMPLRAALIIARKVSSVQRLRPFRGGCFSAARRSISRRASPR